LLSAKRDRYTSLTMFDDFHTQDRWSKTDVHCVYQGLVVAIATRHADAVDVKFLANGKPVTIALPHRAWEEYQTRTGKVITDSLAIQIAGHYLKTAIETGEHTGQEMYSLTVAETMQHLDAALEELLAPAKA
jgi:Fe-S cluster assembly scaffold protein SufB